MSSKQITERIFRNSLKPDPTLWVQKFQNVHFQPTPSDFIIIGQEHRYLVEVKELKIYLGYKTFPFNRLDEHQKEALINFQSLSGYNRSFILINFREKHVKQSAFYLIPISMWTSFERNHDKKSFKLSDLEADSILSTYRLNVLPGSTIYISQHIY